MGRAMVHGEDDFLYPGVQGPCYIIMQPKRPGVGLGGDAGRGYGVTTRRSDPDAGGTTRVHPAVRPGRREALAGSSRRGGGAYASTKQRYQTLV